MIVRVVGVEVERDKTCVSDEGCVCSYPDEGLHPTMGYILLTIVKAILANGAHKPSYDRF